MTAASYADSKRLSHRAVSPMIYVCSLYLSALSQSIGGFCLAIMAVLDSVGTTQRSCRADLQSIQFPS